MIEQVAVTIDLTATTNTRSVTYAINVPAWAKTMRVHATAAAWGTTPAVVEIKHGPRGVAVFSSFVPRALFSSNGSSDSIDVSDKPVVRGEVISAGTGGTFLDTDALLTLVFSDSPVQ